MSWRSRYGLRLMPPVRRTRFVARRSYHPAMTTEQDSAGAFIERWRGITASELSTSQSFVIELCELLGVARPHATAEQDYMFERPVTFQHGDGSSSAGRIDCYR
jgi:hypothetical protein